MQIVDAIRKQVQALGLSPYATSRLLGLPDMTVRRFMVGGVPTLATLAKIEQRLAQVSGAGFPSLGSELTDPKTDDAPRADPKDSAA